MSGQTTRSRKFRVHIAALVLLLAGCVGISYLVFPSSGEHPQRYREVVLKRGPLAVTLVATGVVQPENRVSVIPPINGRVEQVLVQEGDIVKAGQLMAWMSSTERAALLDAARAKGAAELQEWESFYRPTPILAPINGSIIQSNVQPGQSFTASDKVFVIADRLTVKTLVDETDIAQISKGQSAGIVLDAYPEIKLSGQVGLIAFDAQTINSITTYEVDVLPSRPPAFLRSGMTANVTFQIASKSDALLVPAEAVKMSEGRAMVLVPSSAPGLGPSTRTIRTGLSDGRNLEVLEGLKEDDVVLIPELRFDRPEPEKRRGFFASHATGQ